jgi:hypothetical protein
LLFAKPRPPFHQLALSAAILIVGCLGFLWGVLNVARGEASDDFWDIEARLLHFETFSRAASTAILDSAVGLDISPCDNHSQRALMLMEIPVADAALRSGEVQEFDQHMRSLEARVRLSLSCTPRDSFIWLLLFGTQTQHGKLDEHTFAFLAMSYETSPNEAWIAIRRIVVAVPALRVAPEPVQQKILAEFQNLIKHGFLEAPARAYFNAPASTQNLLQSQIDQLDPRIQKNFSEALQKIRS